MYKRLDIPRQGNWWDCGIFAGHNGVELFAAAVEKRVSVADFLAGNITNIPWFQQDFAVNTREELRLGLRLLQVKKNLRFLAQYKETVEKAMTNCQATQVALESELNTLLAATAMDDLDEDAEFDALAAVLRGSDSRDIPNETESTAAKPPLPPTKKPSAAGKPPPPPAHKPSSASQPPAPATPHAARPPLPQNKRPSPPHETGDEKPSMTKISKKPDAPKRSHTPTAVEQAAKKTAPSITRSKNKKNREV